MEDSVDAVSQFLKEFTSENSPTSEDDVQIRCGIVGNYSLKPEEVEGEVTDWVLNYLEQRKCPYFLAIALARKVAQQTSMIVCKRLLQSNGENIGDEDTMLQNATSLHTETISRLRELCGELRDNPEQRDTSGTQSLRFEASVYAIKNGRRKMEDRHVILHDLNAACNLQNAPSHSYYAVFDGHAGVETASFASAHLHNNVVQHPAFLKDTKTAIIEAFKLTDTQFAERASRENLKSGATAVCALIRESTLYIAWLGDSQALLVKQGKPCIVMNPHKPEREDERRRIEDLGGYIYHHGTWRVNGTLAVSRALGDAEHKPFVSNEPEINVIPLDGTEDFLVIACDGLWDKMSPADVSVSLYRHLVDYPQEADGIAAKLVHQSKLMGSNDNITTIVVFLRDLPSLIADAPKYASIFPQLEGISVSPVLQIANGTTGKSYSTEERREISDKLLENKYQRPTYFHKDLEFSGVDPSDWSPDLQESLETRNRNGKYGVAEGMPPEQTSLSELPTPPIDEVEASKHFSEYSTSEQLKLFQEHLEAQGFHDVSLDEVQTSMDENLHFMPSKIDDDMGYLADEISATKDSKLPFEDLDSVSPHFKSDSGDTFANISPTNVMGDQSVVTHEQVLSTASDLVFSTIETAVKHVTSSDSISELSSPVPASTKSHNPFEKPELDNVDSSQPVNPSPVKSTHQLNPNAEPFVMKDFGSFTTDVSIASPLHIEETSSSLLDLSLSSPADKVLIDNIVPSDVQEDTTGDVLTEKSSTIDSPLPSAPPLEAFEGQKSCVSEEHIVHGDTVLSAHSNPFYSDLVESSDVNSIIPYVTEVSEITSMVEILSSAVQKIENQMSRINLDEQFLVKDLKSSDQPQPIQEPVDKSAPTQEAIDQHFSVQGPLDQQASDQEPFDNPPSVDQSSVEQLFPVVQQPPLAALETVEHPPLVVLETAEQSPLVALETVEQPPLLALETVEQPPLLALETVEQPPLIALETVEQPPLVAPETVEHPPLVASETVEHPPLVALETVEQPPLVALETVEQPPLVALETVEQPPLVALETVEQPPLVALETVEQPPLISLKTVEQASPVSLETVEQRHLSQELMDQPPTIQEPVYQSSLLQPEESDNVSLQPAPDNVPVQPVDEHLSLQDSHTSGDGISEPSTALTDSSFCLLKSEESSLIPESSAEQSTDLLQNNMIGQENLIANNDTVDESSVEDIAKQVTQQVIGKDSLLPKEVQAKLLEVTSTAVPSETVIEDTPVNAVAVDLKTIPDGVPEAEGVTEDMDSDSEKDGGWSYVKASSNSQEQKTMKKGVETSKLGTKKVSATSGKDRKMIGKTVAGDIKSRSRGNVSALADANKKVAVEKADRKIAESKDKKDRPSTTLKTTASHSVASKTLTSDGKLTKKPTPTMSRSNPSKPSPAATVAMKQSASVTSKTASAASSSAAAKQPMSNIASRTASSVASKQAGVTEKGIGKPAHSSTPRPGVPKSSPVGGAARPLTRPASATASHSIMTASTGVSKQNSSSQKPQPRAASAPLASKTLPSSKINATELKNTSSAEIKPKPSGTTFRRPLPPPVKKQDVKEAKDTANKQISAKKSNQVLAPTTAQVRRTSSTVAAVKGDSVSKKSSTSVASDSKTLKMTTGSTDVKRNITTSKTATARGRMTLPSKQLPKSIKPESDKKASEVKPSKNGPKKIVSNSTASNQKCPDNHEKEVNDEKGMLEVNAKEASDNKSGGASMNPVIDVPESETVNKSELKQESNLIDCPPVTAAEEEKV